MRDYFAGLKQKLKPGGFFVVQFYEQPAADPSADAPHTPDALYEPSVGWSAAQLKELSHASGLVNMRLITQEIAPNIIWHFLYCERAA